MMKNLYDTSNVFRLDKNVVVVFIFSSCIVNLMGSMCAGALWPGPKAHLPKGDFGQRMLQQCRLLEKPNVSVDLKHFKALSEKFPAEVYSSVSLKNLC